MKGYTPPQRVQISNEPLPITKNITITEGISVKDLAEKLGIRAKDLIARLLAKGVFATINQTLDAELASEMARFFGAETEVITFEEQASKDQAETVASEPTKSASWTPHLPPTAARSCSSTRLATKPSPVCAPAVRKRRTLSYWSSLPMTA